VPANAGVRNAVSLPVSMSEGMAAGLSGAADCVGPVYPTVLGDKVETEPQVTFCHVATT